MIPRPEHPRPIFQRSNWINLNGDWSYCLDLGRSGHERKLWCSEGFDNRIRVPFCPESSLSGVSYTDFISAIWYHRDLNVPIEWRGQRTLLHFGAVDFECEVHIDGKFVGRHFGGSSSFSFDITRFVESGRIHHLVVGVWDDIRSGRQMGGKQSVEFSSAGCFYTRTTGIWQTVWLEVVHPQSLESVNCIPLYDEKAFLFIPTFRNIARGNRIMIELFDRGERVASVVVAASQHHAVKVDLGESAKSWSPDHPFLYDVKMTVLGEDGAVIDTVTSYTGLRKFHTEGDRLFLNNEEMYLRLVLDQGFYPDGIWTAPNEQALKTDIELSLAAGFNGARLHQKVFEPRFHYWADRLGYLTWAESPSWGVDLKSEAAARNFLTEWREIVVRDRNHPSIIAWTTLNETWDITDRKQHHRLHEDAYDLTRTLDPTRPINDASGGCHVRTDLYTVHIYEQNPEKLREMLAKGPNGEVFKTLGDKDGPYEDQPYLVDEFGGIKILPDVSRAVHSSWGYGEPPHSVEEFFERLQGQVRSLLSLEHVSGYCYTQLTDVEQEQNGLYYYDRTPKFDVARLRSIFSETSVRNHTPQRSTDDIVRAS